jgi:site-specific recombinase XerD
LHGKWLKKSLGIRSWEAAQKIVRDWEARVGSEPVSVKDAFSRFLADCRERNLGWETARKYRLLEREMTERFGVRPVDAISVDDLSEYRASWNLAANSSHKKIERLRAFFRFCVDRGWLAENPAALLKVPRYIKSPTLPFTGVEMRGIMAAVEKYPDRPPGRRLQVKTFINVLRYSGLRIGDVVTLSRERITDGAIFLYSHKTGVAVRCPLPDEVVEDVGRLPGGFLFYSGACKPKSAIGHWQRTLKRVFQDAGVEKGHAHRMRTSFAVNLLARGVSLEDVAALLGNSIKIAERHYAPFVKVRADRLEEVVRRTFT